jgi:hypothetical protein
VLKVAFFQGAGPAGANVLPLFGPADAAFEKTASATLLPEVSKYISSLRPRQDAQYVLLNAMGAGEWWGSNVNGDYFPETALIHKPDDWTGNPLVDKARAEGWAYGFPTFYFAHPYAHHRNKDATRAFGEVELAAWHPKMKRVELIARVDKDKCEKFGGIGVWDKLKAGEYVDVSMGCKVPYDTCSICLDWKTYRKAQAMFDPRRHKSPGDAVLEYHKKLKADGRNGIRGLSITRHDYCDHCKRMMNRILPDGRKVFVYNDYPKFFDISFVFVGADKTAKVMMKIADSGKMWSLPSAHLAEKLGYEEELAASFVVGEQQEKTASVDDPLKVAFVGKLAKKKDAEIVKDTVPSQFAGSAVPLLTKHEKDLPSALIDALSTFPPETSFSTAGGLGMVLRPKEFQRIILIQCGMRPEADRLEHAGITFPKVEETEPVDLSPSLFSAGLARLLLPLMGDRSALGPFIERRVLVIGEPPKEKKGSSSSLSSALLRKIGAAYNGYRLGIMELIPHTQDLMATVAPIELNKLASASAEDLLTPLSAHYLKLAFWDEVDCSLPENSVEPSGQRHRGEGAAFEEHVDHRTPHRRIST